MDRGREGNGPDDGSGDREGSSHQGTRCGPHRALMEETKAEGLLLGKAGLRDNVIRFGPSLLVTEEEVEDCLHRFRRACTWVNG